jgi:hypothetical protein
MTYTLENYLVGLHAGQWFGFNNLVTEEDKTYANLIIHPKISNELGEMLDNPHTKPTEQECIDGVAALQAEYDSQEYARNREAEYPTIRECVHAILDDDLTALQVLRQAVKDKYPK